MKTWYTIQTKASQPDTTEISIFDEIGFWGVTAKDFIADLKNVQSKNVELLLNSPGGSVFDGLAIYNALKSSGKKITVRVLGIAASIASVIAMAGDKIVMPENTFLMVHNPWSMAVGNAEDMRDMADVLDKIANSLVTTYVARTGLSEDKVRELLDAESYLSAAEAVELGFADEMTPAMKIAANFDIDRLPENVRAAFDAAKPPMPKKTGEGDEEETDDNPDEESEEGDAPTDEKKPMPKKPKALAADHVVAVAEREGFAQYASLWATNPAIESEDALAAEVAYAKEVTALCRVAGASSSADAFIRSRTDIAAVRAKLFEMLAKQDDATVVDTTLTNSKPPMVAPQAVSVKTAAIWAARKNLKR